MQFLSSNCYSCRLSSTISINISNSGIWPTFTVKLVLSSHSRNSAAHLLSHCLHPGATIETVPAALSLNGDVLVSTTGALSSLQLPFE
jgi:hypothetical protein